MDSAITVEVCVTGLAEHHSKVKDNSAASVTGWVEVLSASWFALWTETGTAATGTAATGSAATGGAATGGVELGNCKPVSAGMS